MTYLDLFTQVQQGLAALSGVVSHDSWDGAETTPVRYAIVKDERRLNDALQGADMVDGYVDEIKAIVEEHMDAAPQEAVGRLQEWARAELFRDVDTDVELPDDTAEAVRKVLDTDAPFEPYTVTEEHIKAEPRVPIWVLSLVEDWMVE